MILSSVTGQAPSWSDIHSSSFCLAVEPTVCTDLYRWQCFRFVLIIPQINGRTVLMKQFKSKWQNKTILFGLDNSTAVSISKEITLWRSPGEDNKVVPPSQEFTTCQIHSGISQCNCRFCIHINSDTVNRVVTKSLSVQQTL